MSASKELLLYLNTKDSTINSNGDYSFNLEKSITRCRTIQLVSFNIPFDFYNIDATNNKIIFREVGDIVDRTASISAGEYGSYSFINGIAAAMTAVGGQTYTVTYSKSTFKITITGSSSDFTIYSTSTIKDQIGLTTTITSTSKILTFQNEMDLLLYKELQIHLPQLIVNYGVTINDMLSVVSFSGYRYGQIMRENQSSIECILNVKELNSITLSVVSESGWSPNFQSDLSFVFRITTY
jgi:hypothetical protein